LLQSLTNVEAPGVDFTLSNKEGSTLLHLAALVFAIDVRGLKPTLGGTWEIEIIFLVLVKGGGDVNALNHKKQTAIDFLLWESKVDYDVFDVVQLLASYGCTSTHPRFQQLLSAKIYYF
jgi:hypothetical protein